MEENPFEFWVQYFDEKILEDRGAFVPDNDWGKQNPDLLYNSVSSILEETNDYYRFKNTEYHPKELGDLHTVYFEQVIRDRYEDEINQTKKAIASGFLKRLGKSSDTTKYKTYLDKNLNYLKTHSNNKFEFTKSLIKEFEACIALKTSSQTETKQVHSFELISPLNRTAEELTQLLYNELISAPSIISCEEKEFISAFSGGEVENGIHWLVQSKNGSTSKVSLFYFLEQLIDNGFLPKSTHYDINKKVKYVFRDMESKEFKNIRQSKASSYSTTSAQKPRIDSIISSLKEA